MPVAAFGSGFSPRPRPAHSHNGLRSAVLQMAGKEKLSVRLARRQMLFMDQLARRPGSDQVRCSVFGPERLELRTPAGWRQRG
eukprot:9344814-Pyramimonas_sp.AAC.1